MQTTSKILMVRPIKFGFNEQTAGNNAFQVQGIEQTNVGAKAIAEFDNFVKLLRDAGVEVNVIQDTAEPHTPDSIFPNNWFSRHADGTIVLYPMFAPNRRLERKTAVLDFLRTYHSPKKEVDLTHWESKNIFLEGTGSMILDREHNFIYACASIRTQKEALQELSKAIGYDYFLFDAIDQNGKPIYHTNVLMCVGEKFILSCMEAIHNSEEKAKFVEYAKKFNKEIIEISYEQMNNFAGNMLELKSANGEALIIMSKRAKESLSKEQISQIEKYCKIIAPDLTTIEDNGGGSARCMIAELFV